MKKLILLLMQTRVYAFLLKHVVPYVRFTTYYADFHGRKYEEARALVSSCDVILTTDKMKLTSLLIPGIVDHAALSLYGHTDIAQMTHKDFTRDTLFDICKESTRVIVMRCPDIYSDSRYKFMMIRTCAGFSRAKYDQKFELGVESLYCSELVYQTDFQRRIKCDLSDLAGLGRPYISPMGLLFASNMFCVYDSDYEFTGLTGKQIEAKVGKR